MLSRPHRSLRSVPAVIAGALLMAAPVGSVPAGSISAVEGPSGVRLVARPVVDPRSPEMRAETHAELLAMHSRTALGSDTVIFDTTGHRLALEPNRPNPFPAVTRIAYSVEADGHVVLTVHDFFYRKVQTLVDADQKAGRYEVAWPNAETSETLSSGMYFCTLVTSRGVEQQRMLLMK